MYAGSKQKNARFVYALFTFHHNSVYRLNSVAGRISAAVIVNHVTSLDKTRRVSPGLGRNERDFSREKQINKSEIRRVHRGFRHREHDHVDKRMGRAAAGYAHLFHVGKFSSCAEFDETARVSSLSSLLYILVFYVFRFVVLK